MGKANVSLDAPVTEVDTQGCAVPAKPCNICASHADVVHRFSLEERGTKQPYGVFLCRRCELVYTDVIFDVSVDESPNYYENASSYLCTHKQFEQRFRHQVTDILRYGNGQRGRLLDYGCGPGYFLRAAQDEGFEVCGFDISRGAQVLGKAIGIANIAVGHPDSVALPGPFNVATMYNVIEHLPDPLKALRRLHGCIVEDGLLVVETPDEQSLVRRLTVLAFQLTNGRWNLLSAFYGLPPHHVFCFSRKSLTLMLEKAGFQVVGIEGVNPDMEFIKHGMGAKGAGLGPWLRARLVELLLLTFHVVRSPTRMIVYARRQSCEG